MKSGTGENRLVLLLSLFGGLGLLALALALLAPLSPTAVDVERINREVVVVDQNSIKPEPVERFLYLAGVVLLPACLGGAYLGVRRFQRVAAGRRIIERLASPAAWLMAPLLLLLIVAAGLADDRAVIRTLIPGGPISLAAAVALAAALGGATSSGERFRGLTSRLGRVLLPLLAGALLLGSLLFTILGPEHIRNVDIFFASFNAVFHSVVQVYFGKELLADFANQYGMYPHFLEPVFRLVGLSVYSFTAVMGLLNCLAFACLYRFLARETADEVLAFLGLATLFFFGYAAGRAALPDLYLQYHPLRTLFPALSLVAARAFAHDPTPRLGGLLLSLAAAAVLWNPDSGVVVLAAGFLLLVYDGLLRRRPRGLPARLLLGGAAAAAVFTAATCLLRLRYGAFPAYPQLFAHARTFYIYGVNMLPMPRFGIWVPVLVAYAAALLLALRSLVEGEDTPRARLFFYLAVLGLGLFTYYQGRSGLGNLLVAGYPAVLIVVLLASDLRCRAPARTPAADRLLSVTLLALLAFSLPALAAVAPEWFRGIAGKIGVTRRHQQYEPLGDAQFLQRHLRPGQEVLIVSGHSGLHHLLTRTISPLDTPGTSEIVLRSDHDKQSAYMINRRGTFVIDKNALDPTSIAFMKRLHPVFDENKRSGLLVFPGP